MRRAHTSGVAQARLQTSDTSERVRGTLAKKGTALRRGAQMVCAVVGRLRADRNVACGLG
jgi:hypothetical protein